MMNANSPTCTREKPACMDTRRDCPESNVPPDAKIICPKMTTHVRIRIGSQYSINWDGLIIMPTDTKKMAPKMFFTGSIKCSMRSASRVSANMDPMTKAPNALLNPDSSAKSTMPKQSPMEKMVRVSLLRCF